MLSKIASLGRAVPELVNSASVIAPETLVNVLHQLVEFDCRRVELLAEAAATGAFMFANPSA
jgi:hypothetical protein